jgi:hypothetical protein
VGAAASGLDDPPPVLAVARAVTGFCPSAALVPRAAQPAVNVTAVSAAAVTNARACQARHLPFPRVPRLACPPMLTRVLLRLFALYVRRLAMVPADNRFS